MDAVDGHYWMSTDKLVEAFNKFAEYYKDLAKEIALTIFRKAYTKTNLTWEQIGLLTGLHRPLISKILDNPEKCELDSIVRFAKALSMDEEQAKDEWARLKKEHYGEKIDAQIGK